MSDEPGQLRRGYLMRYWVEGMPQPDPEGCPEGNVEHHEIAYTAADAMVQGEVSMRRRFGHKYFHLCVIEPKP